MAHLPLVLGSSSPTRRAQLSEFGLAFKQATANVDETPHPGESAQHLVKRLSSEKAQALAMAYPCHLIIGADIIAELDETLCGKPKTAEKAKVILRKASGQAMVFYAGLALYNSAKQRLQTHVEAIKVHFRTFSDETIDAYLDQCDPLECAGGIRSEGLGSALFSKLETSDPSALLGLPLIALSTLLINEHYPPLPGLSA